MINVPSGCADYVGDNCLVLLERVVISTLIVCSPHYYVVSMTTV